MARRHLFGPVSAAFADQNLRRHIEASACVCFSQDEALQGGPSDTWDSVLAKLPAGWQPEFLVLHPQYGTIPPVWWQAPIPIVGLAGDWNLLWHHYRHALPHCDLVLSDATGVARLKRLGIAQVRPAQLFGCQRAFVEYEYPNAPRDIDILFVGNFNSVIQRERLPWLGRVARLQKRWNVHLTTNVFDDDYRKLLARARIVFNRSIRGECNSRTFEAIAARALLFQESENLEVASLLRADEEYVAYTDTNLEAMLDFYLEHEDERRRIAEQAGRRRCEFIYESFWDQTLTTIDECWPELQENAARRRKRNETLTLGGQTWHFVSSTCGDGGALAVDLDHALSEQPRAAIWQHALGVALWHRTPRDLRAVASAFQSAWQSDPRHVVAGLNLAETLILLGERHHAGEQAQRVLTVLDTVPTLPAEALDAVHVPTDYDAFRIEWERAAWDHAGDAQVEEQAKRRLLRWRLYELLAHLTGDLAHSFHMAGERPDLPVSFLHLGNALGRGQRPAEALAHLRSCLALNPFDRQASHAYFQTLGLLGRSAEQLRFVAEQRVLADAAPTLVPPQDWFAEIPTPTVITADKPSETYRIAWHGAQSPLHSLALVNREICARLVERGHEVTLLEPTTPVPVSKTAPLSPMVHTRLKAALSGPADVQVTHQWPPDFSPPDQGHWVMIQPWEFGSIPRQWLAPMTHQFDEIWVPSNYVRNGFVGSGVPAGQVHVIPNGVASMFFEKHDPLPLATTRRFKFLFVGGTIARKGIDLLLKAYEQCFSAQDDVCLVVKDMGVGTFYQGQTAEQLIAALRARPQSPEIEYHAEEFTPEELARLYAACDCLVHPYRGEGFGLPIAEALASGLPVIVTGFGAALDFCRDEAAYLISATAEFLDTGDGDLETVSRQYWARPDVDHLRYLMRHVLEHPEEARAKALLGQQFIRQHFTWQHAVGAVEARIRALRAKPIRRRQRPAPQVAVVPAHFRGNGAPRVSLTMIVKNEEHNLGDCLRSVADLVDEIVIADTGSTDRTQEIARQSGARIVDFPWIDNFAAARNAALAPASGDWIFWMDADDRLDEHNRQKLRELFRKLPHGQIIGYDMKVSCLPGSDQESPTVVDHIRLFPNHPDIRWKYRVHEQILGAIRSMGGSVAWTDIAVQHVGYQDAEVHRRKGVRNHRLLELDYQDDPNDPYTLFNLGNSLHELGRLKEAIELLTRSLRISHPTDSIVRKLYSLVAQCQQQLGQHDAALAACREGRGHYPNDVELLFLESGILHKLGDRAGAIDRLQRLRNSYEPPHFGSVNTALRGHKACNNLAILFTEEGRFEEAEQHCRLALSEAPNYVPAWLGMADIFLKQERFREVEGIIERLGQLPQAHWDKMILQAQLLLGQRQFNAARALLRSVIQESPGSVFARVLVARAYLHEGRDWQAAEQALRDVLAFDPQNAEAGNNLQILQKQQSG